MTTAHRPTYNAAVGGSEQGGNKILVPSRQYSAKELPGQLSMKERPPENFSKKDFKKELLEKETLYKNLKNATGGINNETIDIPGIKELLSSAERPSSIKNNFEEKFEKSEDGDVIGKYVNPFPQDADDENFKNESSEESSSSEFIYFLYFFINPSSEESENELLMREFEKIRKQKEEDQKKKVWLKLYF